MQRDHAETSRIRRANRGGCGTSLSFSMLAAKAIPPISVCNTMPTATPPHVRWWPWWSWAYGRDRKSEPRHLRAEPRPSGSGPRPRDSVRPLPHGRGSVRQFLRHVVMVEAKEPLDEEHREEPGQDPVRAVLQVADLLQGVRQQVQQADPEHHAGYEADAQLHAAVRGGEPRAAANPRQRGGDDGGAIDGGEQQHRAIVTAMWRRVRCAGRNEPGGEDHGDTEARRRKEDRDQPTEWSRIYTNRHDLRWSHFLISTPASGLRGFLFAKTSHVPRPTCHRGLRHRRRRDRRPDRPRAARAAGRRGGDTDDDAR